jgi:hypothetical protein
MTDASEHDCLESRTVGQHTIVTLNNHCFVDDDHIRETGIS